MPDSTALFLIDYPENESPQKLKTRIENIADYLTKELKIPQNRYTFLFAPGNSNLTTVYAMLPDSKLEQIDWKKELEQITLKEPNH